MNEGLRTRMEYQVVIVVLHVDLEVLAENTALDLRDDEVGFRRGKGEGREERRTWVVLSMRAQRTGPCLL